MALRLGPHGGRKSLAEIRWLISAIAWALASSLFHIESADFSSECRDSRCAKIRQVCSRQVDLMRKREEVTAHGRSEISQRILASGFLPLSGCRLETILSCSLRKSLDIEGIRITITATTLLVHPILLCCIGILLVGRMSP